MLHGSGDPGVAGSELTRLLARLADVPAPPVGVALSERLGHWLGWTGAISLAAALQAAPGAARSPAAGDMRREEADFRRVRAGLASSIDAGPDEPAPSPADFSPYRRHCLDRQQAMGEAVGALRQRLREALRRSGDEGARLAAIDAVLDASLAATERSLLGLVPLRLQAHHERLSREAAADWDGRFRTDMQQLLQAELNHRLLPAQGLLDALRTSCQP